MKEMQTFVLVLAVFVLSPATAAAFGWDYCDPETDPYDCECPDSSCLTTEFSDVVDTSDPSAINGLAGISSDWSSDESAWVVSIQATGLPGGALMVGENTGVFASTEAFYDYLGELLGTEFPNYGTCQRV